MPEFVRIPLVLGYEVIRSYKRLAYTPWHALAEFVDNSTESYFLNSADLQGSYRATGSRLRVAIGYDRKQPALSITDNAMGMSLAELTHALHIGAPPIETTGRARFGMGLKTAASWLGNSWSVRTKRLGEASELIARIDVERIARGEMDVPIEINEVDPLQHYTVIDIHDLNKPLEARTRGKVRQYLRSMYRRDIVDGTLELWCFGQRQVWTGSEMELRQDSDGRPVRTDFVITVQDKQVTGWAGILQKGSRARAGFSILHYGRVIKGWPDAWRPQPIYGQVQGSNDLVNQRLVGEVNLDDFEVSHTKDDILWFGTEEEEVGERLQEELAELIRLAKRPVRTAETIRESAEQDFRFALSTLQSELVTPEFSTALAPNGNRPEFDREYAKLLDIGRDLAPDFTASLQSYMVTGVLSYDASRSAPYVAVWEDSSGRLLIVVNARHPYVAELDRISLLDHLRHTVFDAIAAYEARQHRGDNERLNELHVRDRLFRVPNQVRRRHPDASRT